MRNNLCSLLSFNATPYFQLKNYFYVYFFIVFFFIVILENPAPFSLNFLSPMTYSSKERFSHLSPSPQLHPQNQKIPLKTSVRFPITITVCKHWSKFVTCTPSPRDCGGVIHPQRHSYYGFRLCGTKWLQNKNGSNFSSVDFGEK